MAREIGAIEVQLELDQRDFTSGMKSANKEIDSLNSNVKKASKSVDNLSNSQKKANTSIKRGVGDFTKGFKSIGAAGKGAFRDIANSVPLVGDAIGGLETAATTFGGSLGGITTAMGALGASVAGVTAAGVALVGIGLGSYFTQTQEGVNLVNRQLNRASGSFEVLKTKAQEFGKSIVDAIDTEEVSSGLQKLLFAINPLAAASLEGFGKAVDAAIGDELKANQERADQISDLEEKLSKDRVKAIVDEAKERNRIQEELFKTRALDDQGQRASFEEQTQALKDAQAATDRLFASRLKIAKVELEIKQLQDAQGTNLDADDEATARLIANIEELKAARLAASRELENRQKEAFNAEQARLKAIAAEEERLRKEREAAEKKSENERIAKNAKEAEAALKTLEARTLAVRKGVEGGLTQAFSSLGAVITSSIDTGNEALDNIASSFAQFAIDLIAQASATSIANAILAGSQTALLAGPFAGVALAGTIASAIGVVGSALASIPNFASGGVVGGGVYRHSEAGQTEAIIPPNRLNDIVSSGGNRETVINLDSRPFLRVIENSARSRQRSQGIPFRPTP